MLEVKIFGSTVTAYRARPRFRGDPSFGGFIKKAPLGEEPALR